MAKRPETEERFVSSLIDSRLHTSDLVGRASPRYLDCALCTLCCTKHKLMLLLVGRRLSRTRAVSSASLDSHGGGCDWDSRRFPDRHHSNEAAEQRPTEQQNTKATRELQRYLLNRKSRQVVLVAVVEKAKKKIKMKWKGGRMCILRLLTLLWAQLRK